MKRKFQSDFLVAKPSLISGMARLWDFYGLYDSYNESQTTSEADANAIFADWAVVGQDIQYALDRFQAERL